MDTDRAGFLGDADDRLLNLLVGHHHIGEFVDDEHDVWKRARDLGVFQIVLRLEPLTLFIFGERIEGADIANTCLAEHLVAFFHLADGPLQDRCSAVHLGHDRAGQVGNVAEHTQLDHLGVDQNEFDFIGPLEEEP